MAFADFDGDGKCNVFRKYGSSWQILRTGAGGAWQTIGSSGSALNAIGFGDWIGDGKTDLLAYK